jgi:hypothetical protein
MKIHDPPRIVYGDQFFKIKVLSEKNGGISINLEHTILAGYHKKVMREQVCNLFLNVSVWESSP